MRFITEHSSEPLFVYIPTNAPHTPLEFADVQSERGFTPGVIHLGTDAIPKDK